MIANYLTRIFDAGVKPGEPLTSSGDSRAGVNGARRAARCAPAVGGPVSMERIPTSLAGSGWSRLKP